MGMAVHEVMKGATQPDSLMVATVIGLYGNHRPLGLASLDDTLIGTIHQLICTA